MLRRIVAALVVSIYTVRLFAAARASGCKNRKREKPDLKRSPIAMKKYIEVQKNKVKDQEQIGLWLSECTASRIPAIVIYYDNDEAYISASITSLLSNAEYSMVVDTVKIHDSFSRLSVSYSPKTMHYLNHNDKYFTFDAVPLNKAAQAAEEIFDILVDSVIINKK